MKKQFRCSASVTFSSKNVCVNLESSAVTAGRLHSYVVLNLYQHLGSFTFFCLDGDKEATWQASNRLQSWTKCHEKINACCKSNLKKKNSSLKHSWLYRPFPFPPKKQCWSPARPFFFWCWGGGGSVGWKKRLLCWKIGSMGILWVGKCQNFNTFCLHCSLFPSDLKSPSTAFRLCTFFYQYFWEAYHTLASPQMPFGVRLSRIHFYPRDIC